MSASVAAKPCACRAPARWFCSSTRWPDGGYVVTVELLAGGVVIDRLTHPLHVGQPRAQPHFIKTRAGGFWLGGRPWKAHGVNYMPSSGIGLDGDCFEYWLGKGAYDAGGTDRAVTPVIRTEGARFLAAPKPPTPNYWISVDRDRDARGLVGMYAAVQGEY